MKVFVLETGQEPSEQYILGVYSSKELACSAMEGEMEDYERISDGEEFYETTEAFYTISEQEVDL